MKNYLTKIAAIYLLLCCNCLYAQNTFTNPILTGMNPDPSICRVGDDFYLITSTFEYFPGLPIYHSKDLVHWKQIGHVLTRRGNNPLDNATSSTGGQYAPTLRHHKGKFYVTGTNYTSRGTKGAFYVTADSITGPWSDPVWVGNWYVDPSVEFINDTMYYLTPDNLGSFMLGVIDPATGKFTEPLKKIAEGLGGTSPEGPHLYKVNGYYYLMSAEGGTGYEHREVIQRSRSPWGPYEPCPDNPVASNMTVSDHPFQAIGHADLVQLQDESWWLVCLGYRPKGGRYHHLGRETFLAPVTWSEDGWPKVGSDGIVKEEYPAPNLPEHIWPEEPIRDNFDSAQLRLKWNVIRIPDSTTWSLADKPGYLRLYGSKYNFSVKKSPTFVGCRQTAFAMVASAKIDFEPTIDTEEAGIVIRGDDANHFDLVITQRAGKRVVLVRRQLAGTVKGLSYQEIGDGSVTLRVSSDELTYSFWVQEDGKAPVLLDMIETKELSTEKIGGFTGTFIGLYASGNGAKNTNPADFDWFDFEENPELPYSWLAGSIDKQNDMPAPELISVRPSKYGEVEIKWRKGDNATTYQIERFDGEIFQEIGQINADDTVFYDTDVVGKVMYIYRVVGKNDKGLSKPSVAKSVVTRAKPGAFEGTPYQIPGTIQAEHYDYGVSGQAFNDTESGNKTAAFRSDDVDVEICYDTDGGFDIGWIEEGEWVVYTVDITEPVVDVQFRVATELGGTISLELDGQTVASADVESTGGWQTWETVTASGVNLATGTNKKLKVNFNSGGYNFNWMKFETSETSEVSITQENAKDGTYLFPNPAKEHIQVVNPVHFIQSVSIASLSGETVYRTAFADNNSQIINISNLPSGSYFATIWLSNGTIDRLMLVVKD